jgi:hypothetical protein
LAAGNPAGTVLAENGGDLHVINERIKVVVENGGNVQTGTITFVTDD